jgi:nucleoid-associated protein YgaU
MGLVQQAVLEFDEEIQAPWRPRLVAVAGIDEAAAPEIVQPRRPHPSGRSSSRVGVCRPVEPPSHLPARRGVRGSVVGVTTARPEKRRRRPVASPPARRSGGRGLRLTRRARLLATVLTLALGLAIGSWLGPLLAGGDGDMRLAGVQSVVVQPGDTLWSIAGDAAGTADIREVVDRIQELNGLQTTVLVPGQVLELP